MPEQPFVLSCWVCDAGDGITCKEEALALGWVDIERDDGLSWNDIGACPECKAEWCGK